MSHKRMNKYSETHCGIVAQTCFSGIAHCAFYTTLKLYCIWIIICFTSAARGQQVNSSSIHVPDQCVSLAEACKKIVPGGTIILRPGIYKLTEAIILDKPCTIVSENKDRQAVTVLSCGTGPFVIDISTNHKEPDVFFDSITLVNAADKTWPKRKEQITRLKEYIEVYYGSDFSKLSEATIMIEQLIKEKDYKQETASAGLYAAIRQKNGRLRIHNCLITCKSANGIVVDGENSAARVTASLIRTTSNMDSLRICNNANVTIHDSAIFGVLSGIYIDSGGTCIIDQTKIHSDYYGISGHDSIVQIKSSFCEAYYAVINAGNCKVTIDKSQIKSSMHGMLIYEKSTAEVHGSTITQCIYGVGVTEEGHVVLHDTNITHSVLGLGATCGTCTKMFSCCLNSNISSVVVVNVDIFDATNCIFKGNVSFSGFASRVTDQNIMSPVRRAFDTKCQVFDGNWEGTGLSVTDLSKVNLTRCRILENESCGIYATIFGNVTLNDCEISGNRTGIELSNVAMITGLNCRVHSNHVGLKSTMGGQIHFIDSQIDHNEVGVAIENQGRGVFERTKVSDNSLSTKTDQASKVQTPQDWIISPDSSKGVLRKE